MCGLCGIASNNLIEGDIKAFKELLWISALRGSHSTGVATFNTFNEKGNKHPYINMKKQIGPSPYFIANPENNDIFTKQDNHTIKAMIGHCRFATQGEITENNAHPFYFDKVVGVHNGTVSHEFKNKNLYETDSEAIYSLINDEGLDETIKQIDKMGGAYTLIWFDIEQNTLNFIRNDKRPLVMAYSPGKLTMAWASEEEMLQLVASRTILSIGANTDTEKKFFNLPTRQHYCYDLLEGNIIDSLTIKEIKPPVVTYPAYNNRSVWPPHNNYYNGKYGGHYHDFLDRQDLKDAGIDVDGDDNRRSLHQERKEEKKKDGTKDEIPKGKSLVPRVNAYYSWYKGYKGEHLDPAQMAEVLKEGCIWCSTPLTLIEPGINDLFWLNRNDFICDVCLSDEEIVDTMASAKDRTLSDRLKSKVERLKVFSNKNLH